MVSKRRHQTHKIGKAIRRASKRRRSLSLGINKVLPGVFVDEGECLQSDIQDASELVQIGSVSSVGPGSFCPPLTDETYPQLGYLWVYEPQDLDEMSLADVHLIWEHREALCGSREAAAEALAILEVAAGVVETYQGWMAYRDRVEVVSLMPNVEPCVLAPANDERGVELTPEASAIPSPPDDDHLDFPALGRQDLAELTEEELQDAWNRRPESFSSLEAACGALALLRSLAGIDSDADWQRLMAHSEIQKLADDLPDRDNEDEIHYSAPPTPTVSSPEPALSPDALRSDQRTRRQSEIVVREGQPGFRQEVLDNYAQRCCVTGCRLNVILEAAHISPYAGAHSNHPANGLCLRVDIHRLFDAFLISIDPFSRQLVIAGRLNEDSAYQPLNGKHLVPGRVPASSELLSEHYQRFLQKNPEMPGSLLSPVEI